MIDTLSEDVISFTEVTKILPCRRGGKKVSLSCVYRWSNEGCRGVKLDWICIGGTRFTSHQALQKFFEALSEKAGQPRQSPQRRGKKQRELDKLRAEQELDKDGY